MNNSYWYSKLSVAQTCARKYKYQFLDKIPQPGVASGDIEFGQAIHLAIEAYFEGEDGILQFNAYWESVKAKEMVYTRFKWADLKALGMGLLRRFERLHLPHLKPQHNEQRLIGKIGDYQFEGTPDFVGLYKGIPTVLDFKTSGKAYLKERILVDEQLYIYAHLAKQVLGFDSKEIGYMVFCKQDNRIQTSVSLELTPEKMSAMIGNVELQIKDLEIKQFYPANGKSCAPGGYKCAYWDLCYGGKDGSSTS